MDFSVIESKEWIISLDGRCEDKTNCLLSKMSEKILSLKFTFVSSKKPRSGVFIVNSLKESVLRMRRAEF